MKPDTRHHRQMTKWDFIIETVILALCYVAAYLIWRYAK